MTNDAGKHHEEADDDDDIPLASDISDLIINDFIDEVLLLKQ
jgi:hypothetical protein